MSTGQERAAKPSQSYLSLHHRPTAHQSYLYLYLMKTTIAILSKYTDIGLMDVCICSCALLSTGVNPL